MKKLYYTISEVSEILGLKTHIIRYWIAEIPKLQKDSVKGKTIQFIEKDLDLMKKLKELIYEKKFTLEGAKAEIMKKKTPITENPSRSNIDIKQELLEIKKILLKRNNQQ